MDLPLLFSFRASLLKPAKVQVQSDTVEMGDGGGRTIHFVRKSNRIRSCKERNGEAGKVLHSENMGKRIAFRSTGDS